MSVAHQFRDGMKFRVNSLFQNTIFRYLFGIAAVASVFALRIWLIPLTGTGAPFVLFFAAVLVTSLFAGVGPAICAVLLSMPLGAYTFVVGAGYSIVQASFQSLLFAVDGIVVIYLTFLTRRGPGHSNTPTGRCASLRRSTAPCLIRSTRVSAWSRYCSMTQTTRLTTAFWKSIGSLRSRPASRTPLDAGSARSAGARGALVPDLRADCADRGAAEV